MAAAEQAGGPTGVPAPGGGKGAGAGRAGGGTPGHGFRKVTLTKPTFCHLCSDFIWGLAGFQCDVCNFMSHEKCLRRVRTACPSVAPSRVRVPVAHCFGPRGLYKRRFCAVCRKGLEVPALRCEVCELHVHLDCVPFACSDCRQCHLDRHHEHEQTPRPHHWREGNPVPGARCEACKRTCGSSDVLAGVHCEWCGLQAHSSCSVMLAPECTFGHLRSMLLPPACVRLLSRNFRKTHCFRIAEAPEPGEGDAEDSAGREVPGSPESGKLTMKIFDGDDALRRNRFRLVTVSRQARSEEVLEAALRAYYLSKDLGDFELQALPLAPQACQTGSSATEGEEEGSRGPPEAQVLRVRPRAQESLSIYSGWLE